eukprot:3890901-Rhodomonas_salina.1
MIIPSAVFNESEAVWDLRAGTLSLTIAPGMVLPEDRRTVFNMFVRNSVRQNVGGRQCGRSYDGDCLIVTAQVANLCNLHATDASSCAGGTLVTSSISTSTGAVDHHNVPLLDQCSTCLRQWDLVHVDDVLQEQATLVISDLEVSSPTTRGLPTYIVGGVVPGTYAVVLEVTNWVGEHAFARYSFTKKPLRGMGGLGPTGLESIEPLVYFDGPNELTVDADTGIEVKTMGSAALCQPDAEFEMLNFQWSMECAKGFATLPCDM